MNELLYLPVIDRNSNYHELGLLASSQWLPMYTDRNSDIVNRNFLAKLDDIDSIKVSLDCGTATFRKENSKYWKAYKKLKGKLNKVYIGLGQVFTELTIVNAVEMVNTKAVAQNNDYVTEKPLIELAGKGKSDRHLQTSLITENQALKMSQAEIKELKVQNDNLVDRIIHLTDLYQEQWQKASKLEDELNKPNIAIADFNYDLQEISLGNQLTIDALENEVKQLHKTVAQLEHKASKDEEYFLGYKFCAEQNHEELYKLECEHQAMQYCIDQYRALASGKTRQAHPRFNKLLDFIADIDKLC